MTARPLVRESVGLDRSRLATGAALAGAIGFALPLAIGLAVGEVADGVAASVGALIVGFANLGGAYRVRAATLLAATGATAVAALVGGLTGSVAALAIVMAGVWGFGGGMLVALGKRAAFVGMLSTWALLLTADLRLEGAGALHEAWLIAAGGLLQTVVAIVAWPLRPRAPEQAAAADAYGALAAYAREPTVASMEAAGVALAEADASGQEAADRAQRRLVEQGEWIRVELVALVRAEGTVGVLAAAAAVLDEIARKLVGRSAAAGSTMSAGSLADLRRRTDALADPDTRERAATLTTWIAAAAEHRADGPEPFAAARRSALETLRAELTLRSSAFRHAARLAVALMVAVLVYRVLPLGFGYWVPVTVLFVLKPDYGTTFSRGIGRAAGTMLGVVVAAALVSTLTLSDGAIVAVLAFLGLAAYALFPAGYAAFSVVLTVLVALLTEFAGGSALGAVEDRLLDTAIGGAIALAAFVLWPTREAPEVAARLATLADAQARWARMVLSVYDGAPYDGQAMRADRLAARRARADAVAAVERALAEPASRRPDGPANVDALTRMDDMSACALALTSAIHDGRSTDASPAATAEAKRLRTALRTL